MFSSATILREIEKNAPPCSNATKISSVFSLRAEERRERRRRSYDGADTRDRSNVQTIIINPHKNWSPPFREGRRATREREEKGRRTHQELKQVIAVVREGKREENHHAASAQTTTNRKKTLKKKVVSFPHRKLFKKSKNNKAFRFAPPRRESVRLVSIRVASAVKKKREEKDALFWVHLTLLRFNGGILFL